MKMPRCLNCHDEKQVCCRCGRTPLVCADKAPVYCNGHAAHVFVDCPECRK